jgi:hypothetical protein
MAESWVAADRRIRRDRAGRAPAQIRLLSRSVRVVFLGGNGAKVVGLQPDRVFGIHVADQLLDQFQIARRITRAVVQDDRRNRAWAVDRCCP